MLELAERCEQASGPDRELDAAIAAIARLERVPDWARNWSGEWRPNDTGSVVMMHADGTPGPHFMSREYTTSLDAAITLVPPDWHAELRGVNDAWWAGLNPTPSGSKGHATGFAATSALALTAACLRAREALSQATSHG